MSINEFEIEFDIKPNEFEIEMKNIQEIYPELEDIEITPTAEEQKIKSEDYYGYNEVTVKAIPNKHITLTQAEYDDLVITNLIDENIYYYIKEE